MKIAIFDIDDTITYESDFIRKYAHKFLENENLRSNVANKSGYSLDEIYGLKYQFIEQGYSLKRAEMEAEKIEKSFGIYTL